MTCEFCEMGTHKRILLFRLSKKVSKVDIERMLKHGFKINISKSK